MDYKSKLVNLVMCCLNDSGFYNRSNPKFCILYNISRYKPTVETVEYFVSNGFTYNEVTRERKKHQIKDIYIKMEEIQGIESIEIIFETEPTISIFYNPNVSELTSHLSLTFRPYFFGLFGKKRIMKIKKVNKVYTPEYSIMQGSLKAKITQDEVDMMITLYKTNLEKFKIERDEKILNKRLKNYKIENDTEIK